MNKKKKITIGIIIIGIVIWIGSALFGAVLVWMENAMSSKCQETYQGLPPVPERPQTIDQVELNELNNWFREVNGQSTWITLTLIDPDPNAKYHVFVGTFSDEAFERAIQFPEKEAMELAEYQDKGFFTGPEIKVDNLRPVDYYPIKVYLVEGSGQETLYGSAIFMTAPL